MYVSILEKEIALGIAATVRAQTLAASTLDRCIPGMVGDAERQRLQDASRDLALAASYTRTAQECFTAAAQTLGRFTNREAKP